VSSMDHNEIYLQPTCCVNEDVGRLWCEDPDPEDCEDGKHWTRYVRSDIHESTIAQLEALRQERDKLRARVAELEDYIQCTPEAIECRYNGECEYKSPAALSKIKADAVREAKKNIVIAGIHRGNLYDQGFIDAIDAYNEQMEKYANQLEADNG